MIIDHENKRIGSSFFDFLLKERFNRVSVLLCITFFLIEFLVFKYYYPFAAFISGDSYEYVSAAFYNLSINIYPIGYPKFLRIFSVFLTDDLALVTFQYFSLQLSVLWLLMSLFYIYRPDKKIQVLLLILISFNPIMLYVANYVSSDSLFIALSVCWFTILIWILSFPSYKLVLIHAVLLLLAFMVRYYALYYPVISIFVFLLSGMKVKAKILGSLLTFFLLGGFVMFTSLQYKKLTGNAQFSPFSGWQMANNGLYAYRFVDSAKRKELPAKFRKLDQEVRTYFDETRILMPEYPNLMLDVSAIYMWTPSSPLRTYMEKQFVDTTVQVSDFKRWATVAPLYNDYGKTLIRTYPGVFAKRYLWSNFIKYYAPPIEFLETYGFRMDTIPPITRAWFGYHSFKLKNRINDNSVTILNYYPIISGTMNAVFLMMSISFFVLKGRRINKRLYYSWMVFFLVWMLNMIFSVFASPVALRFQIFPLVLCVFSNFLLLDFILKQSKQGNINRESERLETALNV